MNMRRDKHVTRQACDGYAALERGSVVEQFSTRGAFAWKAPRCETPSLRQARRYHGKRTININGGTNGGLRPLLYRQVLHQAGHGRKEAT